MSKTVGTRRCVYEHSPRRVAERHYKTGGDLAAKSRDSHTCQHIIGREAGQQFAPHRVWYGLKETGKHVFDFDQAATTMHCHCLGE
jgi:hypothetical protein